MVAFVPRRSYCGQSHFQRLRRPQMKPDTSIYDIRVAQSEVDLLGAQRLRYRVFVEELGADGPLVDHANRFERDELDAAADHLVLVDRRKSDKNFEHIVGVYRLLPDTRAREFGHFYSDQEYDLSPLIASGRPLLELGRSCLDPAHRGGAGVFLLWNALADYVLSSGVELLFGTASFHGTNPEAIAEPLAWLHHNHLAPPNLRPRARPEGYQSMDLRPVDQLDRRAAMLAMPPLLKAYLRLGGTVGEGAYIDRVFNTIDVLLIVDTKAMSAKHRSFYENRVLEK